MSFSLSYVTGTEEGNEPKCFASEKGVEGFAVGHVLLTGEEHPKNGLAWGQIWTGIRDGVPIVREDYLLGGVNEAGFSIGWGVEDFA